MARRLITPQDHSTWDWLFAKWQPIAYRTKQVIFAVMRSEDRRWWPHGEGTDLMFERHIEAESGAWPYDREVVTVSFDLLGRLKSCRREKVIVVEQGRSHADLCRMLGVDEERR